MDKGLKKELKKVLNGRVIVREDGMLIALTGNQPFVFQGVVSGWEAVRFGGISCRKQRLRVAESDDAAFEVILAAMQNLGRLVDLACAPAALACVRRYFLNRSVVIVADYEGDGVVCISVYTGRGLFSGFSRRRGMNDFCRALPLEARNPIELPPKTKKERKQEAKQKKEQQKTQQIHSQEAERPASVKQKKGKRQQPGKRQQKGKRQR